MSTCNFGGTAAATLCNPGEVMASRMGLAAASALGFPELRVSEWRGTLRDGLMDWHPLVRAVRRRPRRFSSRQQAGAYARRRGGGVHPEVLEAFL